MLFLSSWLTYPRHKLTVNECLRNNNIVKSTCGTARRPLTLLSPHFFSQGRTYCRNRTTAYALGQRHACLEGCLLVGYGREGTAACRCGENCPQDLLKSSNMRLAEADRTHVLEDMCMLGDTVMGEHPRKERTVLQKDQSPHHPLWLVRELFEVSSDHEGPDNKVLLLHP